MSKTKVIFLESHDPWLNLAYEDVLFRHMNLEERILLLYINEPSIVMGRFQNPWQECNVKKVFEEGIHLVRRLSGGGCVYHDLGNLNFSLLSSKDNYCQKKNDEFISKVLTNWNLELEVRGHNSYFTQNKKISGNAFKQLKDRKYQHGTLLVKSDLTKLNDYLQSKDSLEDSRALKSVPATVVNLSDLDSKVTLDNLKETMIQTFFSAFGQGEKVFLSQTEMEERQGVIEKFKELLSEEWIFHETPKFSYEGREVTKGRITSSPLASEVGMPFFDFYFG